jgi:hypothetical protein
LGFATGLASCGDASQKDSGKAGDSTAALAADGRGLDVLTFKIDTVLVHDTACPHAVFACTYVMVEYPVLAGSGAPPALASNLMRGIGLATNLVQDTARRIPTLENLAQSFVDSFSRELALYKSQDASARIMPWFLEVRTAVAQQQGLVFLSTEAFTYTGGAYPYMHYGYRAFDRLSGAPVALDNLLQDGAAKAALTKMAERKFRQQEGLSPTETYAKYFFEDFVYNLYEIKPYADGFTHVRLPLAAVDSLLVPAYRRVVL